MKFAPRRSGLTVRRARRYDRTELLRMRCCLWPDSEEPEVDDLLDRPDSLGVVLVAERPSGLLAGFAEIGLRGYAEGCTSSPVAYLEGIWVDPDSRRSGVGASLVRETERWALGRGLTELASDCEFHDRNSQGFHVSVGFEEVRRVVCFRRVLAHDERTGRGVSGRG